MTDDLVERLRHDWFGYEVSLKAIDAMDEAADSIKQLVATNKQLTAERDRLRAALRDGRRLWAIAQEDRVQLLIQLEQCEGRNE